MTVPQEAYRLTLSHLHSHLPMLMPGAIRHLPVRDAIAVTVDDGPVDSDPDELLTVCAEFDMRVMFFLTGERTERYPGAARKLVEAGHSIASHGWSHTSPLRLTRQALMADIRRSLAVIEKATGTRPMYYRPPYGRLLPTQRCIPGSLGCRIVLWSRMPGDWYDTGDVRALRNRIARVRGGEIVVLHDRPGGRARLMAALTELKRVSGKKHLTFRTIGEEF